MRIVQIGLGVWGEKNSEILSQLGVLSAVCELDTSKAKLLGEKHSVNFYDSIENLRTSEEFDAACIDSTVPNALEIASNLLYDKKHVFVEKPMTDNSVELEKIREISEKKKTVFTCSYSDRFEPVIIQLKKNTESRQYGEIVSVVFFNEGTTSQSKLRFQNFLNDIDIVNQIFGEMPLVVFARMFPNEDIKFASIILGYSNNKSAVILSNSLSAKTIRELKVVYSEKTINADIIAKKITDMDGTLTGKDSMHLQAENFKDSIEGKNEPLITPLEIVNNVKIAEAALLSSKQGVPIYLDLK